ncbi:MAG TPA: phosphodiesterase [Rhizobiales bacterium]|nr:phosphodiesterase [Hyphomicrobiales bacterium]
MLVAQISDTHITVAGKKAYGVAPVDDMLARAVAHINRLEPAADVVLLSGDVTYSARPEEAREAARLLGALNCPYYVIPGNHDDRDVLWSVFGGAACPSREQGFIHYTVDDYPVRLIGLDSTSPGAPGGAFCPARAAWLEARLKEAADQPTLLFMHHPPVKFGVLETDEDGFSGADRLGDIIAQHRNIKALACGHIHLPAHALWRGTAVSTAPSTGMQLALDLTMKRNSEFLLEDPGYQLHYWSGAGELVTHTVYVRDRNGPHLFIDHST